MPVIQMGLFMDGNGIPVCMDVFQGNISDSDTLKENLDGFKKEYGMERTIVIHGSFCGLKKRKEPVIYHWTYKPDEVSVDESDRKHFSNTL